MASINKVMLIGTLGKDPDKRATSSGDAVTSITLATKETWKDKAGEKQEKTEWHKVVFFRKVAEIAGEYLHKGSLVYIEGKLETKKWEKDGVTRYSTQVNAHEMKMLGQKQVSASKPPSFDRTTQSGFGDTESSNASKSSPAGHPENKGSDFGSMDEDVGF